MEQLSGRGQESARRTGFQRKYLRCLVAMLRRGRIERAISVSSRSRSVKFAADLSLAMTLRCRTAWSRAILGKYILRIKKSRCQMPGLKFRGNFRRVLRSAYAKTRPCKSTANCMKFAGGLVVRTASSTGHNSEEESGGGVASRLETLRLLVPGSHGLETSVFLKEAAEYIVALKMQVGAMQALADCYSNLYGNSAPQV